MLALSGTTFIRVVTLDGGGSYGKAFKTTFEEILEAS